MTFGKWISFLHRPKINEEEEEKLCLVLRNCGKHAHAQHNVRNDLREFAVHQYKLYRMGRFFSRWMAATRKVVASL